jgi:5-methylcytosine-specific restriction endonuclease McrA
MDRLAHVHAYLAVCGQDLIDRSLAKSRYYSSAGNVARRKRMAEAVAKGTHDNQEWAAILRFYGHKCLCCQRRHGITKDHVIQVSKGGSDGADNLQPLCKSCNCAKQDVDYRWDNGEWAGVVALASVVGE